MLIRLLNVALSILLAYALQEGRNSQSVDIDGYEQFTNQSLFWAPYRSNCYFGIRPRYVNDHPFMFGLMWMDSTHLEAMNKLRHLVDQNDKLDKYGWEVYDPRIGGKQTILDLDNNVNLTIYYFKSRDGANWGARIRGEPIDSQKLSTTSLVLYMNQNGGRENSHLVRSEPDSYGSENIKLRGLAPEMGEYHISINDLSGLYYSKGAPLHPDLDSSKTAHMSLTVPDDQVWIARDILQTLVGESIQTITSSSNKIDPVSFPSVFTIRNMHDFPPGNFHFIQKTFDLDKPFEFDIIFNNKASKQQIKSSSEFSAMIEWGLNEINNRFDNKFHIQHPEHKKFAQETLSNLMGGIGYFYGTQLVDRTTEFDDEQFEKIELSHPEEEGPLQLFSCVPSRAFFPRGFYWDEGFHLLQVMEYDFDLAFEIMQSWFELIEEDSGWVARELILGNEARSKVPEEFRVQNPNIANPPTLLLAFSEMLSRALAEQDDHNSQGEELNTFPFSTEELERQPDLLIVRAKKIFPKLLKHYDWFTNSQRGMVEEYVDYVDEKVHPMEAFRWIGRTFTHCLPSGMDDYPRAQPPDVAELHVDTLAWVGVMTRSMRKIAAVLSLKEEEEKFAAIEKNVIENLDILHWNPDDNCYCDITIDDESEDVREFVCHQGYISLLPFALKLMTPDSPKLKYLVDLMSDSDKLFTGFGLASLSKQDEYFETGEVYWRGPVWININYLCLDALVYYFQENECTDMETLGKARSLYSSLRENIISNMYRVWAHDGFVYENYNHRTGNGTGVRHFTGWSALVVNIIGRLPEQLY